MQLTIQLPDGDHRIAVTGPSERNLKLIREALGIRISARDHTLRLIGDDQAVAKAASIIEQLTTSVERHQPMSKQQLIEALAQVGSQEDLPHVVDHAARRRPLSDDLDVYLAGKKVRPATDGQRRYLRAILDHDLTFCVGPAGTGKTYLAVAAAVAMLRRGDARKLILARPAVEAGERLGFLPGTMQDKVNPYLRPLLDALHDMMEFDQITRFMAADLIEIVPLAFMRGRTLNDGVIILDEAQNTTKAQMLMFLTRLGHGSKMVVTGDTSQIDLENPRDSGLIDAVRRLRNTKGIATITLDGQDIVRHNLVQRIITAYGEANKPQHPDVQTRQDFSISEQ